MQSVGDEHSSLPLTPSLCRFIHVQIGPGGFDTSDFEIVQQLGSISMQQVGPSAGGTGMCIMT